MTVCLRHIVRATVVFAALLTAAAQMPASANSRLKDIADFEGVRDNQLVGYGLIVGLNGTGDTLNNSPFTKQSLIGMRERLSPSRSTRGRLAQAALRCSRFPRRPGNPMPPNRATS